MRAIQEDKCVYRRRETPRGHFPHTVLQCSDLLLLELPLPLLLGFHFRTLSHGTLLFHVRLHILRHGAQAFFDVLQTPAIAGLVCKTC